MGNKPVAHVCSFGKLHLTGPTTLLLAGDRARDAPRHGLRGLEASIHSLQRSPPRKDGLRLCDSFRSLLIDSNK